MALAREARERAAGDTPVAIAGSISSFAPEADSTRAPTPAQARAGYREQAELLAGAGVDLLVLEMMRDIELGSCAIEEAVATGLPTWVGFSCRMAGDGATVLLFGGRADEPFAPAIKAMMEIGGSVAGVMHTDVEDAAAALEVLLGNWSGPVAAYPHSGGFIMPNWQFDDIISPDDYASEARKWVESGVQIVGGCCGIGPGHVRLLKDRLPRHVPAAGRS